MLTEHPTHAKTSNTSMPENSQSFPPGSMDHSILEHPPGDQSLGSHNDNSHHPHHPHHHPPPQSILHTHHPGASDTPDSVDTPLGHSAAGVPHPEDCVSCIGCGLRITERWFCKTQEGAWHNSCLRCVECQVPLEDKCFTKHGHLYCRDDYYR